MELFGLLTIIIVVAAMVFFRRWITRVADYSEEMLIVNTKEGSLDLTERANVIANRLEEIGPVRVRDLDDLFASKGIAKNGKIKAEKKA